MAAYPAAVPARPAVSSTPLAERALLGILFVTMLLSSVAFVEPSPHDGMMIVLAAACLIAGVAIDRTTGLLIMLLVIWNVAGLLALANVAGESKTIQYAATSIYLALVTIVFACLVSRNTMGRLASLRSGYIASAVVAAIAGVSGHFHLFPGAGVFEEYGGRAQGMFKDPNVYAPYLIWPTLLVMSRLLLRGFFVRDISILGVLLGGIFLSFSRGAWGHLVASAAVMLVLFLLTAPTPRMRMRITTIGLAGVAAIAVLLLALLSLDSVRGLFFERAQAIQSYDVGQGGRFQLQELALSALLDFPLGMGPFEFGRVYGLQQHNVYLQAFLVYGWFGGFSYLLLLVATFVIGFRALRIATPWQPYLVTAYAAVAGEVGEGFIIDTDHWRHFFLLLGMVWGLSAATIRSARTSQGLLPAVAPR
ncbi:MAG: O-antigen ligase family protein [Pseudolabrys sp.]